MQENNATGSPLGNRWKETRWAQGSRRTFSKMTKN